METGISDPRENIFDLQCPRTTVRGSQTGKENRIVEIRMTEKMRHTTHAYSLTGREIVVKKYVQRHV